MQRPASSQAAGNAQSSVFLQVSAQCPLRQAYGAQPWIAPFVSRVVRMSMHTVPATHVFVGLSQPKPSAHSSSVKHPVAQVPALPSHRFGEQDGVPREPRGSGVQVPRVSVHVSHAPSHATLQQIESTQNPLAQSDARAQTEPLFFLHAPFASHVFSPVHVSGSSAERTASQTPAPEQRRHAPSQASAQQSASLQ
jgi:hypothetical protein